MYRFKLLPVLALLILSVVFILNIDQAIAQSADEQSVLTLINQERTSRGLQPYSWDNCLASAATRHSNDMSTNNFLSHTGSDNSSAGNRIFATGYPTNSAIGENIASGYTTPASVVNGWMNSSGHRANILSTGFNYVGISRVNNYWTNTFGSVACNGGSPTGGGSPSGGGSTTGSGSPTGGGSTTGNGSGTGSNSASTNNSGGGSGTSNNSTGTSTSNNPVDDCVLPGGSVQVSAANGMNCTSLSSTGVGNQSVLDQGFINAVDVWGNFSASVEVCLSGIGSLIFMDASNAPRIPQAISSSVRNNMTCSTISTPGSVILVGTANQALQTTINTGSSGLTTTAAPIINTNGNISHIVQAGENLFRIGLRYGVPYPQIAAVNNIGTNYRIFVGQQLIIPQ